MNINERNFMNRIQAAEAHIPSNYEMEIEHIGNGWFVYKYSQEHQEATPTDLIEPIITDEEAAEHRIDIIKCLNAYDCYYVA